MKTRSVSSYRNASIFVICLVFSWSTLSSALWYGNGGCDYCQEYEECIDNTCMDVCDPILFARIATGARCVGKNHKAHWSCPKGYSGNPFYKCYKRCTSSENCDINESCKRGRCRKGFQRCREGYIRDRRTMKCVKKCKNEDCVYYEGCIDNICGDVCDSVQLEVVEGAFCYVRNHTAQWFCPEGYTGDPFVECYELCKDAHCEDTERCINDECENVCNPALFTRIAANAICHANNHMADWSCPEGYSGDPFDECIKLCEDADCKDTEKCIDNVCGDACNRDLVDEVAAHAVCHANNHKAHWSCPEGYSGDPFDECIKLCEDTDCKDTETCINNACMDVCDAAQFGGVTLNAICHGVNHTVNWSCPEGYVMNYYEGCQKPCRDADCRDNEKCINDACMDVCNSTPLREDAPYAVCDAKNHIAYWSCIEGYDMNPYERCEKLCEDANCKDTEKCIDNVCGDACNRDLVGKVAAHAVCHAKNHMADWSCPEGYSGEPFDECIKLCKDADCKDTERCIDNICRDVCRSVPSDEMVVGGICRGANHTVHWSCPEGYVEDPYVGCYKLCEDANCKDTEKCIDNVCGDACNRDLVGKVAAHAVCHAKNHMADWSCPEGYSGEPFDECIKLCEDTDCKDTEKCIDNVCGDACNRNLVGEVAANAVCHANNHMADWSCPEGYSGDPFDECIKLCEDTDCKDTEKCIDNVCGDACNRNLVGEVAANAVCHANNHMADWSCPEGYSGDPSVTCSKPCEADKHCGGEEFCVKGKCRVVCDRNYTTVDARAECHPLGDHKAQWTCPMRYPGDPFITCGLSCNANNDCPTNTTCVNRECRDSCDRGLYTVAQGAECIRVGLHGVKWKCPDGYYGIPYLYCGTMCRDEFCPDNQRCVGNKCHNACDPELVRVTLVSGAICNATNHTGYWSCPKNSHGNPFFSCDEKCRGDNDCLLSEKCLSGACVSACSRHFFKDSPTFGMCSPQNHTGRLFDCAIDRSPEAVKYCRRSFSRCMNDNDCMLSDACKNSRCTSPCFDFTCTGDTYCETQMHEPVCVPFFWNKIL